MGSALVPAHGDFSSCSVRAGFSSWCLLVAGRGLCGMRASVAAAHGLSSCHSHALKHRFCSWSTRFPDQGSNLCLLHGLVDSSPLSHQRSLKWDFKNVFLLFTLKYPELLTFFYLLLLNIISLFIQEYTHFYPADTLNVLIYCGHIFSDLYVALMRF